MDTITEQTLQLKSDFDEVYEAGKQAEYDAFWDGYQQNGNRTNYKFLFQYGGWNIYTFKPKYDMQPTDAMQMFYWFNDDTDGNLTVDLVEVLNGLGVTLDFSKAVTMSYCFQNSKISHLGVIDASNCTGLTATFCNMYWLNKIDKVIVHENLTYNSAVFSNCYATDITFEGVIGNTITFANSIRMDANSAKSAISCLKNYAGTDKEYVNTFTLRSSLWTQLESSGTAPDGGTWKDYINSLGWNT